MTADNRFIKKLTSFKPLKLAVKVGLLCGLTVAGANTAFAGTTEQAKRMHDRLAGIPPTAEMLCAMEALISANDAEGAAFLVMRTDTIAEQNLLDACDSQAGVGNSNGRIDNDLSKKAFYSVSIKNFVMPWTNEDMSVHEDLNDFVATVIGVIRDEDSAGGIGFDEILSADILYKGVGSTPSPANNDHYEALQNTDADLSLPSVLEATTQTGGYLPAGAEAAGVVTTRAASLAFFSGGTNRLMWRATSMNFLCRDLEEMKDTSRPHDHVRQDVSRSPGGDSLIYLNACVGCHAGMDPLAGAYAYYDHELTANDDPNPNAPTGRMLWKDNSSMFEDVSGLPSSGSVGEVLFNQNCSGCHTSNAMAGRTSTQISTAITNIAAMNSLNNLMGNDLQQIESFLSGDAPPDPNITVTHKHLINASNFEYGYVTKDNHWANYWREGPNSVLEWGWNQRLGAAAPGEKAEGYGAASLGEEVTSTKAFAQCQVEKVYKHVCLHDPVTDDSDGADNTISSIAQAFKDSGYKMKGVFARVAAQCMGD